MRSKIIAILLAFMVLGMIPVIAENDIKIMVDNNLIVFNQDTGMTFIDQNNRTQVPFRASMDAIGAEVKWDSLNRVAIATKGNISIKVPIGEPYILVNQKKRLNDTEAVIIDNRTYLPIRIVMESFGYTVTWNAPSQTIVVTSGEQINTTASQERSVQQTFGIRHDRALSEYEALAKINKENHPDFSPVASITYSLDGSDNHDYITTGTLIAPQWVLSAGHNFYIAEEQKSPAKAAGLRVNFGTDPNKPTATYRVEKIIYHPTWIKYNDGFYYANDYSLIKLAEPVINIEPATLMRTTNEPLGSVVWFAGFGDYSQIPGQNDHLYSPKHAFENVLDRKTDGVTSTHDGKIYAGGYLAFDFDDPTGQSNTLGDNYIGLDEHELGVGSSNHRPQPFEGTTVEGDSGGPLFVYSDGDWRLAGVLSGGAVQPIRGHVDCSYGDISIFMRVSTQIKWIDNVLEGE